MAASMFQQQQRRFVDWDERFVSHDRGSRVVYYYLRDRHGRQCLAVIGTERSLRHMVYVVCDEFLPLVGLDKAAASGFKWRARREVVDWLSSFLAKTRSPETVLSTGSPKNLLHSSTDAGSALSDDGAEGLESSQEECRSRHHENYARKRCALVKADVVWVGSASSCRKRLRHFHSFQRNGITIHVQDFVYVMTEEKDRQIAYVEDLYEDKKLRKRVRVRWFHKNSELHCRIPPPTPQYHEVFFSDFRQDLSVECVDGVATVLSPEHHELCSAALPADVMAHALVCYRHFDSDGIKPFNIQQVKGYWQQAALSRAGVGVAREISPHLEQGSEDLLDMDDEGIDLGRLVRRGPRTARCSRRRTGLGNRATRLSNDGAADSSGMSGEAGGSGSVSKRFYIVGGRIQGPCSEFEIGDHIEVLSEDSGLRGCWFKGTVLGKSMRRLKFRYDDVLREDGKGNLEEWISSCKVAGPDIMDLRIPGRSSIRPCRPEGPCSMSLSQGESVDAWWHDGWWEGIHCGKGSSGLIRVLITGEMETADFKPADLRVSKEWLNGVWTRLPRFPDLAMFGRIDFSVGMDDLDQKQVGPGSRHLEDGSPHTDPAHAVNEESQSSVHDVRHASAQEAANQTSSEAERFISLKVGSMSIKEEPLVSPSANLARGWGEEQNSASLSGTGGSTRSGAPSTVSQVDCRSRQESHDDGVTSEVDQSQAVASSGSRDQGAVGLKWKVGRKRHRHGDLVSSRVERNAVHSAHDPGEGRSPDSAKEEVSSLRSVEESVKQEDLSRWKTGEDDEAVKLKRHRQNGDGSRPLHGSPIGSPMFIASLPVASLVMSR